MHLQTFTGDAMSPYLDDLARLRIKVFREWPYLYEGSLAYERDYLATFARARDSILLIAFDGPEVAGASTGLPLAEETAELRRPFAAAGYSVDDFFYFSESVLRRSYRGRGAGKAFFHEREAWARRLGRFRFTTFCGVVRPDDHPLRPAGHVPLDGFWRKMGYRPTDLIGHISWQDIDEAEESPKPLRFWMKQL